jgi:hypothetical protein
MHDIEVARRESYALGATGFFYLKRISQPSKAVMFVQCGSPRCKQIS